MKPKSKMASPFFPKCPTCGAALEGQGGKPDAAWPCLGPGNLHRVCARCYVPHTAKCCPNLNVERSP